MKALQILLVIAAGFALTACEYRYRYECQDPVNWGKEQCQKPLCEVEGFCPDHIMGKAEPQIIEKVEQEQSDNCNCDKENNNVE